MIFHENRENLRIAGDLRIDHPHPIAIAIGWGALAEQLKEQFRVTARFSVSSCNSSPHSALLYYVNLPSSLPSFTYLNTTPQALLLQADLKLTDSYNTALEDLRLSLGYG